MTKLFKNSKQILAFVFALAVLAVSLFTGGISMEAEACDVSNIDYWDGTAKPVDTSAHAGTEDDPYIIENAEQLASVALQRSGTDLYTGKYFKIADNIDVLVMQPENVVDLNTLMSLDSAEAVKDYLTGLQGVKNWISIFWGASFNGNFDGNGVTIYGLYADGVAANKDDVGLFPQYDGGYKDGNGNVVANTCKNVAVKNSYFNSRRRVGAISGASYGTGYGAKIDGIVRYDTIAVVNCYISTVGGQSYYNEQGIVVDGGSNDVSILNNVLVSGNYGFNSEVGKKLGIVAANNNNGVKESNGEVIKGSISNSIILGTDPFRKDLHSDMVFYNVKDKDGNTVRTFFNNVVTDKEAGKITVTNPSGWETATTTAEFTEANIKQVTSTGFDFQRETANNFDWENVWFMSENGPELRAFHGEIEFTTTYESHLWQCKDCGLTSPGGVADHNFVCDTEIKGDGTDVYTCADCGYTCQHNSQSTNVPEPGDCVTAPGVYSRCAYCDWYFATELGEIPGHKLEYVPAYEGTCAEDGHTEYWYCSVCDNKFSAENKFAPMENAATDADLNSGLGAHILDRTVDGLVVGYNENGHWYICSIDGGRIDYSCKELADDAIVKHDFNNAKCVDCGYECTDHDWKRTGKKLVKGDCFNDEQVEISCKKCLITSTEVTKKAGHNIVKVEQVNATDKLEGTKAHYYCKECDSLYADAEGKTSVTRASLVIRKVLPAEYRNPDDDFTSPSTRNSVASVVAVAALAGAAFVIARKVKK